MYILNTLKLDTTLSKLAAKTAESVCYLHLGVLPPHQISARGSQPNSSYEVHVTSLVRLRLQPQRALKALKKAQNDH